MEGYEMIRSDLLVDIMDIKVSGEHSGQYQR